MAQQTAMEQLIEWISSDCTPMDCIMKAKELLQMEKEQIVQAYQSDRRPCSDEDAEQYYNETFGNK